MHWFGEDLLVLRLSLLAVKVALAVLLFRLSRSLARPTIALGVTAWWIAVWCSPLWLFWTGLLGAVGVAVALASMDAEPREADGLAGLARMLRLVIVGGSALLAPPPQRKSTGQPRP